MFEFEGTCRRKTRKNAGAATLSGQITTDEELQKKKDL